MNITKYLKLTTIFLLFIMVCNTIEGQIKIQTIHSKSLENALLKINPNKNLAVYLPPSYLKSNKKYPVIYYLPGYTSPIDDIINGGYEGFKLQEVMDDLISQNIINEMIVVLCDGSNFLGGNFYTNSPLIGNAEDYIVKDIVDYIDQNYRTIKASQSRAISGHSMGGYGSLEIATKHPDIFGVCYSLSPGIYDEHGLNEHHYFNSTRKIQSVKNFILKTQDKETDHHTLAYKKSIKPLFDIDYDSYYMAFVMAYGAAFSYDISLPFPHIVFPTDTTTHSIISDPILKSWQDNGFGDWENKITARIHNIKKLNAIAIDCGKKDEWIFTGSQHVFNILKSKEINVNSFWHEGDHSDFLHIRLKEGMLPFCSKFLSFEN